MNKKAIAILGAIFLLIVGTLGFLLYSKYGKKTTPDSGGTQATSTPVTTGQSPATTTPISTSTPPTGSKVVLLASDQVISPALYFDGSSIAWFDAQGNLYQGQLSTDSSGVLHLDRKTALTIKQKANISRILWPTRKGDDHSNNNFIAEFNFGGKKTWSFFNAEAQTWTDLPAQVESVDWLPGGKQIVYVWLDTAGKATINVSNPDATSYQLLADMYETDDLLSVSPDGRNILYYRQYNTDASNSINLTSSDAKLWRGLVKTGYNFGVLWSPDGSKFLYGQKEPSSQKYQLWVYDLNTGTSNSLGVFSIPSKAVWAADNTVVYAAVPNTGNADDTTLTVDDFYKIDTSNFDKKKYSSSGPSIDGRNLFLNTEGNKLLFKNAQDGGLYYLDLN
jgi:hypothetical protein